MNIPTFTWSDEQIKVFEAIAATNGQGENRNTFNPLYPLLVIEAVAG